METQMGGWDDVMLVTHLALDPVRIPSTTITPTSPYTYYSTHNTTWCFPIELCTSRHILTLLRIATIMTFPQLNAMCCDRSHFITAPRIYKPRSKRPMNDWDIQQSLLVLEPMLSRPTSYFPQIDRTSSILMHSIKGSFLTVAPYRYTALICFPKSIFMFFSILALFYLDRTYKYIHYISLSVVRHEYQIITTL